MREIKFRAWNNLKPNRRMIPSSKCRWQACNNSIGCVLLQYTGLKDKNGKEIYEGDICRDEYCGHLDVVRFGKGFEGEPADGTYPYYGWCFGEGEATGFGDGDLTILGNIYENPELLKED